MRSAPTHAVPAGQGASAWPAALDLLQSLSGLALGLFMWLHMGFVSTILISEDLFWIVARSFEGYFIFGKPYYWLVSIVVAVVFMLLGLHALLALRKFPADWAQYRSMGKHSSRLRHGDTWLWLIQVATGFALFFLAPVHLYTMMSHPELIGPYESADRVWTGNFWPLYLILLFAVELHATIGLYRLALKWGWLPSPDSKAGRRRLVRIKWALTAFFLVLGLASLAAYIKLGIEHAPNAGEPYTPAWIQEKAQ